MLWAQMKGPVQRSAPFRIITFVASLCHALLTTPLADAQVAASRGESSFVHSAWTAKDGLPGAAVSLAQTTDGFLWIGTASGLYRFDGVRIQRYVPQDGQLQEGVLAPLFATGDGGLWIGYNRGGLSFLKNGTMTHFTERDGLPRGQPRCLAQGHDGGLWAAFQGGLSRFDGSRWQRVGMDWNYPAATAWSVVVDRDGTVWALADDRVYALPRGAKLFQDTGLSVRPGMLLVAPDNGLWLSEPSRQTTTLLRKQDGRLTRDATTLRVGDWRPIFDRRGGLWVGGWGNGSIYHRSPRELSDGTFTRPGTGAEAFRETEGLTDNRITEFLEDREGNIWIATNGGLDRLRRRNLTWFALPPGSHDFSLVPGQAGEILATSQLHETIELPRRAVRGDAPKNVLFSYRDPGGTVWVSSFAGDASTFRATLSQWNGRQLRKVAVPADLGSLNITAMATDRAADLWLSASRKGVYRVRGDVWTHVSIFADSPTAAAAAAMTDATGRLWFAYPARKQIAVVADGTVQQIFTERELPIGAVRTLAQSSGRLWAGGDAGVAFVDGDRFHRVVGDDGSTFTEVKSIVPTDREGLWFSAQQGIVHIPRLEVDRVVANPAHRVSYDIYDESSDLPDRLQTSGVQPGAVQSSDGSLWFATRSGVARIDPRAIEKNPLAPPVLIHALSADAKDHAVAGHTIALPALTREVRIAYAALEPRAARAGAFPLPPGRVGSGVARCRREA